jgi:cell division protein FtsB
MLQNNGTRWSTHHATAPRKRAQLPLLLHGLSHWIELSGIMAGEGKAMVTTRFWPTARRLLLSSRW